MADPDPVDTAGPDKAVSLRAMCPADWPAVSEIYRQGLETGNATFETEVPEWERWDASRLPECRIVATGPAGRVVGWAALGRVSRKMSLAGVAEVSIYVEAGERGRGIGTKLLDRLITESEQAGVWTLQAAVFPENESTIRLHERAGFRNVGRREKIGRHHGRWRDTLLLERRSPNVGSTGETGQ